MNLLQKALRFLGIPRKRSADMNVRTHTRWMRSSPNPNPSPSLSPSPGRRCHFYRNLLGQPDTVRTRKCRTPDTRRIQRYRARPTRVGHCRTPTSIGRAVLKLMRPRKAFPPSASTARACRPPVAEKGIPPSASTARACRAPVARLSRARRPPVAPFARLSRDRRATRSCPISDLQYNYNYILVRCRASGERSIRC